MSDRLRPLQAKDDTDAKAIAVQQIRVMTDPLSLVIRIQGTDYEILPDPTGLILASDILTARNDAEFMDPKPVPSKSKPDTLAEMFI
jgi:hypothetical protein